MDTRHLTPGGLYAVGNPDGPKCVVLIDPDAWRWDSRDSGVYRTQTFVPRSQRRLGYKRIGARTGVNTGALVLRPNEPVNPAVNGPNSLLLAAEPITALRRGSRLGNVSDSLVTALTQGPDSRHQPWVTDLLTTHGLHFDLIDPRAIVSTWEDWEIRAVELAVQTGIDEDEAEAELAEHDEMVSTVAAGLASLDITFDRFHPAMVTEVDSDTVRMSYAVLSGLLAKALP